MTMILTSHVYVSMYTGYINYHIHVIYSRMYTGHCNMPANFLCPLLICSLCPELILHH